MPALTPKILTVALSFVVSINPLPLNAQAADPVASRENITWTEVPTVDKSDPTLQRGIVYGPHGKPLAGAKIYAASTVELFKLSSVDEVTTKDLGDVRAVTDELGRFEFHASDLTWLPASGLRKRWETLLVASKEGLAPGWIKTWGEDRSLRSHWHPHLSKTVEIHLAKPTTFRGRFLGPSGKPVADAQVKVTALNVPRKRDLNEYIRQLKTRSVLSGPVGYQESFSRPWLIPGLTAQGNTDADGNFVFDGFPAEYIVGIEVTHPAMQRTKLSVAVREMDSVFRQAGKFDPEKRLVLLGSGFTHELPAGVTLGGQVKQGVGLVGGKPVVGATVALANHNASDGMTGQRFTTDDEGRFEITGLGPDYNDPGYEIAVVGSFDVPIQCKRFTVHPTHEARLKLQSAVPYQLKLTDANGERIDREVYSIVVQRCPDQTHHSATYHFNKAAKVAPGVYQGIVPKGPGAVIVPRGSRRDRPVSVDPKAFFEPGRKDWTAAEARYAYGDQWQVTGPGIIRTSRLAPNKNATHSQLNMAAVVFTNGSPNDEPLELEATVIQDDPPNVTLVDAAGGLVDGVRVQRQLTKYNAKNMPSTIPLYGLHPNRAEFIQFQHEERGLIGFLRATLTDKSLRVVMTPAATLTGRFVNQRGESSYDIGAILEGAVPPRTHLSNFSRNTGLSPQGRFAIVVPADETYLGKLIRKTFFSWYPRPNIGHAFGPVTPKAGEIVDLGEIVVP